MKSPFRSIRQTLFNEGKLLRYLGYAVGEIALIIIGIMMALQLNNWNEDRQAQAEFDLYIVQLKEDVQEALSNAEVVASSRRPIDRSIRIVQFLEDEARQLEEMERFENDLSSLGRQPFPQFHIGSLGRILNGDIEIIKRERELNQRAMELESSIDQSIRVLDTNQTKLDQSNAVFLKYRSMYVTLREEEDSDFPKWGTSYDLNELLGSSEFIYAIKTQVMALRIVKNESGKIAADLESFLAALEEYDGE